MTTDDLIHFVEAQGPAWRRIAAELAVGRKTSHWMWFVFPQLAGLGFSDMARRYAIRDLDHARRYLAHPLLGARLREATDLMLRHAGTPVRDILGSPDDLKFGSSMTLFGEAAGATGGAQFFLALAAFCDGVPDARTLALLRR
jgi:uncharacterized protein (DUF1810 family)